MNQPQREHLRIKGVYRVLAFTITSRPIFLIHGAYKAILTKEGGRLALAGKPAELDLDIEVKLNVTPFWKGKAVNKLIDLDTYAITSLAPGIVSVNGLRSPFLFYGNCWFQLSGETLNNEEPTEEEDGQMRFATAIDKMEKNNPRTKLTPIQRQWQGR